MKHLLKGGENKTHGHTSGRKRSPEYRAWRGLKDRCLNPRSKYFQCYGGRGITVCKRWSGPNSFVNFLADMGLRPGKSYSLDRRNTNGPYSPKNCRWATKSEQVRNRREFKSLASYTDVQILKEAIRRKLRWKTCNTVKTDCN